MAIDATVGGVSANSFETLAEAEAYFVTRLHDEAWDAATDEQKEAALIWATRLLDGTCWTGAIASQTQALSWPRTGMVDRNGRAIASTTIPAQIKWAESELALGLLVADRTLENQAAAAGLTKVKVGPIELGFKEAIETLVVPASVTALLVPSWLCPTASSVFVFEVV